MSRKPGYWWLVTSGVLFAIYCLNIALGKIGHIIGEPALFSLGDIGEAMILFFAVISFMIVILKREAKVKT